MYPQEKKLLHFYVTRFVANKIQLIKTQFTPTVKQNTRIYKTKCPVVTPSEI